MKGSIEVARFARLDRLSPLDIAVLLGLLDYDLIDLETMRDWIRDDSGISATEEIIEGSLQELREELQGLRERF